MALIGGNKDGKADADVKTNGVNKRNRSTARDDRSSASASFADDPLDPMLEIKKRARRRLIGAIALVVGAIVFVPMIFDSGKNPVVDDISIQIPDKNTPFEPGKPMAKEAAPVLDHNVANSMPTASVDEPASRPAAIEPASTPITTPIAQPEIKPAEKTAEKPVDKPLDKPVDQKPAEKKPEPARDNPRAVALLEGKTGPAKDEKATSYAVQIGAFSDPEKVKFLREKLAAGGFKSFTEVVKTPQGERTRLRIGPYTAREDADKAQERIKKLFVLDGTVVPQGQ